MVRFENNMELVPLFEKGDYIISTGSGDMAIVNSVDKKGYYHFKAYYNRMFKQLFDVKSFILHVDYQKFMRKCTDEERKELDAIIKEKATAKKKDEEAK